MYTATSRRGKDRRPKNGNKIRTSDTGNGDAKRFRSAMGPLHFTTPILATYVSRLSPRVTHMRRGGLEMSNSAKTTRVESACRHRPVLELKPVGKQATHGLQQFHKMLRSQVLTLTLTLALTLGTWMPFCPRPGPCPHHHRHSPGYFSALRFRLGKNVTHALFTFCQAQKYDLFFSLVAGCCAEQCAIR